MLNNVERGEEEGTATTARVPVRLSELKGKKNGRKKKRRTIEDTCVLERAFEKTCKKRGTREGKMIGDTKRKEKGGERSKFVQGIEKQKRVTHTQGEGKMRTYGS